MRLVQFSAVTLDRRFTESENVTGKSRTNEANHHSSSYNMHTYGDGGRLDGRFKEVF